MLISASIITNLLKIKPIGLIHIGAHQAEELEVYREYGWGKVLWVEAIPKNVSIIEEKIRGSKDQVVQALVWSESGINFDFNVTNNGQSSSILKLNKHTEYYPEIVVEQVISLKSKTVKEFLPSDFQFDLVMLDIQGAELPALIGFEEELNTVKYIYTEVNKELLYENCTLVENLDHWLETRDFKRVLTVWTKHGWGDALYIKKDLIRLRHKIICAILNFYFMLQKSKY